MNARTESNAAESSSLSITDASGRLPVSVMLVWLCAFAGLAAYTASWYMPGLAALAK